MESPSLEESKEGLDMAFIALCWWQGKDRSQVGLGGLRGVFQAK